MLATGAASCLLAPAASAFFVPPPPLGGGTESVAIASGTYVGEVTPVVPAPGSFGATPGPVSFKVSSGGRRITPQFSVFMSGNYCGGAGYSAGVGGFYPRSAMIARDGSFRATRKLGRGSSSLSGRFERGGRATGRFTFKLPRRADVSACAGSWKFSVHLAPAVPHGAGVSPAAGASVSGQTYQGEPITVMVNSAADAVSGSVSVMTVCRSHGAQRSVWIYPYYGSISFSAPVSHGQFSASANGLRLQIEGAFVRPRLVGGTVRLAFPLSNGSTSCDSGPVPFVAGHERGRQATPTPGRGRRRSGHRSLASLWNSDPRLCHPADCVGGPDLVSPAVAFYYHGLLVRTGAQLDRRPAAAAEFFRQLDAHGVVTFVDVSDHSTLGLLPSFPRGIVPARIADGVQVLAVALHSRRLSPQLATHLTVSFLHPALICTSCASSSDAVDDLAAITIVDYYWGRGRLLSQYRGSVGYELLSRAVGSSIGWNTVTLGAAAYAAAQLPRGSAPKLGALAGWIAKVRNGVVAPLVSAMGVNWVNVAEENVLSSNEAFAGISSVISAAIPVPVLSQLAGLVLGMWGASQDSRIATQYTQVIGFANEHQAMADVFCLEALLKARRIHAVGGGALANTAVNLRKVWKAYVTNSRAYRVTVTARASGGRLVRVQETPDELPLGVPSFIPAAS